MLIFVEDRGQLGIPKLENFVSPFVSAPAFRYFYRKQEAARHTQTRKLRFPRLFLLSPFAIFTENRRRLGITRLENFVSPFVSALAFRYFCKKRKD